MQGSGTLILVLTIRDGGERMRRTNLPFLLGGSAVLRMCGAIELKSLGV